MSSAPTSTPSGPTVCSPASTTRSGTPPREYGGPNGRPVPAVTTDQLAYVKAQLTELLTNYGPIPLLVFDGWGWRMGHRAVPYDEIRALVKSLQPGCLLLDNAHIMSPWESDLAGVEEAQGGAFIPEGNTFPGLQMQKINASGGNDWFWAPNIGRLMTETAIVDAHLKVLEPRWTNFLLNCPPNRDGLLDDAIVARLAEVGASLTPTTRARRCRPSLRRSTSPTIRVGDSHQRHGQAGRRRHRRLVPLLGLAIGGRAAASRSPSTSVRSAPTSPC